MSLIQFRKISFFVVVLCFLVGVQNTDWQGYGNMSASNLTTIWGYIRPNIDSVVSNASVALANSYFTKYSELYNNFSTGFSNYLNEQYHPAWNVIVIQSKPGKDAILYGYAFRDHWMWYNGYISNGFTITFIIWKDYNCQVWVNIDYSTQGTLDSTSIYSAIVGVNDVNPNTDIWGKTKKFMDQLVTKDGFKGDDKAFTVIGSENPQSSTVFGRVCLVGASKYYFSNALQGYFSSNPLWGYILVLQMR